MKGSFTMFSASKIATTSPFHPERWYLHFADREDYGQLARRISRIVDCGALAAERAARAGVFGDGAVGDCDAVFGVVSGFFFKKSSFFWA